MNQLVSIIIPTRNSARFLEACLRSIRMQSHKKIEIILVDGKSTDDTRKIAKKYKCKIYSFVPNVPKGAFDASYKRNYGAKKAKGSYVYWMDADMELPRGLVAEAIKCITRGAEAVILPEDSFGTGIWAQAKKLERRCYWGDNAVECPRFFKRSIWDAIGGLDETLGAGGDDLDIHQKVLERGYKVARTRAIVLHNEGALTLTRLIQKHFMYGRDTVKYFYKRPRASIISYFPIRAAYIRNIPLFMSHPITTFFFVIMRTSEYAAGFCGFVYSFFASRRENPQEPMDIETYAQALPQYYEHTLPPTLHRYLKTRPFRTLLDAGCGDGSLMYALLYNGFFKKKTIYGVDLSKKRIALVKAIDPRIHAYVDDALVLKHIKTRSIDFYISTYVIEHVDDKKMLGTAARVLRKNGTAYISTVFKKWWGWYYYRRNGKWVMDVTHLREYMSDNELFRHIDKKSFDLLESKKSQMSFPIIDFIVRRLLIKNRGVFMDSPLLTALRKIKIPIPGYYEWEIILRKK